jgi:hypothetical protein
MRNRLTVLIIALTMLTSCGQVTVDLPGDIGEGFDLDTVLDEVRDCDKMSQTFVAVVSEAADQIDALAARSGGRVDPPELRKKIEAVSVTEYFRLAERIGCEQLQLQTETIDRLEDLDPTGSNGQDLIDAVLDEVAAQR